MMPLTSAATIPAQILRAGIAAHAGRTSTGGHRRLRYSTSPSNEAMRRLLVIPMS